MFEQVSERDILVTDVSFAWGSLLQGTMRPALSEQAGQSEQEVVTDEAGVPKVELLELTGREVMSCR